MMMTEDELKHAFNEEQKSSRPPVTRDDLPLSYEAITPVWLSAVLCDEHAGAEVVSYSLDVADDGNTNRRRIFVEYNAAGKAAGLPASVFCKSTHGLANRLSVGLIGGAESEVNFYNEIRPQLSIEAPVGHFANSNPQTLNSIIMLNDLDAGTIFCQHTTDITRARIESQLSLLAAFHGKFLESPVLDTTLAIFPTWVDFFSIFDTLFKDACDQGFVRAQATMPDRLFARRGEIWQATMQSSFAHNNLPHTLTHGDVHLRNWYITGDGRMGLNDWQSSTRGHWSRDVVYTIVTALTVDNRRAWGEKLLAYYVEQLSQASGKSISSKGVFDLCRQQLLSVLAYWTITLNPAPGMPDMQPSDATMEFLKRITAAIDDWDALDSF